jgi:hypothetical protein
VFSFPDCAKLSPPVLPFHDVSFAYNAKSEAIYENVSFGIDCDSRIGAQRRARARGSAQERHTLPRSAPRSWRPAADRATLLCVLCVLCARRGCLCLQRSWGPTAPARARC